MAIVCCLVAILRINHIQYSGLVGSVFVALGGTSSAIWGLVVSKQSGRVSSYKQVLLDFLDIKAPVKRYGLMLIFILILFGKPMVMGEVQPHVQWYTFIMAFIVSIIFGGIEEIGWRYTFQPMIEKHISYELASFITFVFWGIWHYMYFYISDSLTGTEHGTFLVGLLGSCFILSAIYKVSGRLWLCVMYHCLLNMLSQTMVSASFHEVLIGNSIGILLAIVVVRSHKLNTIFKANEQVTEQLNKR